MAFLADFASRVVLGSVKYLLERDWIEKAHVHSDPKQAQRFDKRLNDLDASIKRLREQSGRA